MADAVKQDSNITGLRYAEEASYKTLPANPTWYPLEPNSYDDFGGQTTVIARNPINPSRQRKKGVISDLDASGGFNIDLTQKNSQDVLQGFMYADMRRKVETDAGADNVPIASVSATQYVLSNLQLTAAAINVAGTGYTVGDVLAITETGGTSSEAVVLTVASITGGGGTGPIATFTITTAGKYSVAPTTTTGNTLIGGTGTGATVDLTFAAIVTFTAGMLVFAENFGDASNNGLKRITAVAGGGTNLTIDGGLTAQASPSANASLSVAGRQFNSATLDVVTSGTLPRFTRASGVTDYTTFGLIPGEWIYIGGDTTSTAFDNAANNGPFRVRSVAADYIEIDKSDATMVDETGTGKTIHIFFARVLKNELGATIKRRTYQLERQLGAPDDALPAEIQAEYLIGQVPNELTANVETADKINVDMSFTGADVETVDGPTPLKSGDRPSIEEADAFNTSSDFSRIKLAQVIEGNSAPSPLFAFAQSLTITINNNNTANKAIGVLGAFEVTAGTFQVGGEITAYFSNVTATNAVRNNVDITLDLFVAKANAGFIVDIPLLTLGDGRPDVTQDEPITLPLTMDAATGAKIDTTLDYTLMWCFFPYLPTAAENR